MDSGTIFNNQALPAYQNRKKFSKYLKNIFFYSIKALILNQFSI